MINTNAQELYEKLTNARNRLKTLSEKEERIALINYIENLYSALMDMNEKPEELNTFLGLGKSYHSFCKDVLQYEKRYLKHFIKMKSFHQDYLDYILEIIENNLPKPSFDKIQDHYFSRSDFWDIFFSFLKE